VPRILAFAEWQPPASLASGDSNFLDEFDRAYRGLSHPCQRPFRELSFANADIERAFRQYEAIITLPRLKLGVWVVIFLFVFWLAFTFLARDWEWQPGVNRPGRAASPASPIGGNSTARGVVESFPVARIGLIVLLIIVACLFRVMLQKKQLLEPMLRWRQVHAPRIILALTLLTLPHHLSPPGDPPGAHSTSFSSCSRCRSTF